MKIKIANKRSKQSVDHSQEELIGAIAKHNYAKSNPTTSTHTNYMPKSKESCGASRIPQNDVVDAEVIESTKPRRESPIKLRLTNKCKNCGEVINQNENYCYQCKMIASRHQQLGGVLNQTIIIKEKRRDGCLQILFRLILLIILLPIILYLFGLISLGAIVSSILR